MIGRNNTKPIVITISVLVITVLLILFAVNRNSQDSDSKSKSSETTTSTVKQTSSTSIDQESTSTSLKLDGISISMSSPIQNQTFADESIQVRAIIEGTTSGTCKLTFSQEGSDDIVIEAPVVAATSYYSCEGFDVDSNLFSSKGEWTVDLKIIGSNGKSGSEKRKITLS